MCQTYFYGESNSKQHCQKNKDIVSSNLQPETMEDCKKQNQPVDIIPIASQKEIRKSIEENLEPPDGGCQVRKIEVINLMLKLLCFI